MIALSTCVADVCEMTRQSIPYTGTHGVKIMAIAYFLLPRISGYGTTARLSAATPFLWSLVWEGTTA